MTPEVRAIITALRRAKTDAARARIVERIRALAVPLDAVEAARVAAGSWGTAAKLLGSPPGEIVERRQGRIADALEAGAKVSDIETRLAALSVLPEQLAEAVTLASEGEAVLDVVRTTDAVGIWLSERDACLECIDMNGAITMDGSPFEGAGLSGEPVTSERPPLHPHCRCEIRAYGPEDAKRVAEAARREGRREILRGESAYASLGQRLAAASYLLDSGGANSMPKSVVERAAIAVRDGMFPDRSAVK